MNKRYFRIGIDGLGKNNNNWDSAKKLAEEEILKQIYCKNCEFTGTEEPDFIVKVGNEIFGVEVTSFFIMRQRQDLKR